MTEAPTRIWPVRGFAPGGYACRCNRCQRQFEGDKRAGECAECALTWLAAEHERLMTEKDAEIARLRDALTGAARDVLAERQRQIEVEGWSPRHDDNARYGEIARAAGCYATHAGEQQQTRYKPGDRPYGWPWHSSWWKPTDRRRDLVKAGALILAEIDRIDRAALGDDNG